MFPIQKKIIEKFKGQKAEKEKAETNAAKTQAILDKNTREIIEYKTTSLRSLRAAGGRTVKYKTK